MVFGVEAYEIDAIAESSFGCRTCYLEHDGYARCSVVGGHYGCVVVGCIGIVVSPCAAVPVCGEQYSVGRFGVEACLYVAAWHVGSIVARYGGVVLSDLTSNAAEAFCYPVAAGFVGLRAWHAWPEGALRFDVCHC